MKCIIDNCYRLGAQRGLCLVCYSKAKKVVDSGKVTWDQLVGLGLAGDGDRGGDMFNEALKKALEDNDAKCE